MGGSIFVVMKLVIWLLLVVAMPLSHALTCGQVATGIKPCINYLKTGGALPPQCCDGIRSLNNEAKTTVDRKAVCNCLKSAAKSITGINLNIAAGLPGKCGVNVPYKISPSTDCNNVQ
ncbi:non-specific lipid-transfer protein 1-like [Cannabis sativa]|uniref:non-specific lipid-transfer protein 1-like n=1 Tax=Cannabis sativa TaxID=3483 RepID=UPI0029C9CD1E|nr:non-specific lipid-transfer protein 1-like [Cannabis sativa]